METPVDEKLRDEAKRFHLVFTCDDCAYFRSEDASCSHGYPTAPHRKSLSDDVVVFCKEFDAGP
jgi:hypothetical protein